MLVVAGKAFTIHDPDFYEAAADGAETSIDLETNSLTVGDQNFSFSSSAMERELVQPQRSLANSS